MITKDIHGTMISQSITKPVIKFTTYMNFTMTMMTSNDSHICHDERLVLTIYSVYILRHTEHQTTTSIFILLICYCEPQVTVHVSGEFYDWLSDWLTDHGAMDISGDHLIFLLIEHQMTHMSTTTNALSSLYIHHIF